MGNDSRSYRNRTWTTLILLAFVAAPATTIAAVDALWEETDGDEAGEPRLLTSLGGLDDPATWTLDAATGIPYRRATAEEITLNEWAPGAFLVAAGAQGGILPGAPSATLLVPTGEGSAVSIRLGLVEVESGVPYALTRIDGGEEVAVPVFYRYLTASPTDPLLSLAISRDLVAAEARVADVGGLYARALIGSLAAEILGPEPSWRISPVPGPGGETIDPSEVNLVQLVPSDIGLIMSHCNFTGNSLIDGILHSICNSIGIKPQCSDGQDNDGDKWVDYPNDPGCSNADDNSEIDSRFTMNFGIFGEIKWCTRNSANWQTLANNVAGEINSGYDANGGVRADPVHIFSHCWTAASQTQANNCANSGGCTDGNGHAYTFNSCVAVATCYRDRAWSDVSHARQHFSFSQLKFVQVQHDGTQTDPGGSLCGLSRFKPGGDSVSIGRPYSSTGCKDFVSTHEAGHSFDATHNNALESGCGTVMAQSSVVSCRQNYFANVNRREVNDCVVLSNCPRSGTG